MRRSSSGCGVELVPMTVEWMSGDLFADPSVTAFAHGCNCAGVMGKGIALHFKRRWPAMFEAYRAKCRGGEFRLGDVFVWEEDNEIVYNLATQESWRTSASLVAVEASLAWAIADADRRDLDHVALPRIGAGLGGLPWSRIRSLVLQLAEGSGVRLLVCEEFVAGAVLTPLEEAGDSCPESD